MHEKLTITIYTDGSYSPPHDLGAWAALLFVGDNITTISGLATGTSQHRMELTAIMESISWLDNAVLHPKEIIFVTDSQYVVGLRDRRTKLEATNYVTRKGNELHNTDLIKAFYSLTDTHQVQFIKVKAHAPATNQTNYNSKVDLWVRSLLRAAIAEK